MFLEPNLSCEALEFFKKLNNKSKAAVQTLFYAKKRTTANLYVYRETNLLFADKICTLIFFAAHLKKEALILNFHLSVKFKKNLFSVFNFGCNNIINKFNFFGYNPKNVKKFFEAKNILLKKNILLNPKFIQGKNFILRDFNLDFYQPFLKEKIKTLVIITLKNFSNEEGAIFLNLPNCSFKNSLLIFCYQTNDTVKLRKLLTAGISTF